MLTSTYWARPSQDIFGSLSPGIIHVWRAHLDNSPLQAARYGSQLSADEFARADRYRVSHAKNQFITTRGILRSLLAHYVVVPPSTLRIENNAYGKPRLADPTSLALQFNVSHTSGIALLAFTVEYAVGIDVEQIDRTVSDHVIATRYFSPRESAYLAALSPDRRTQEFLTYWTCKEAYLKMQGTGLSGGLARCEIALAPDGLKADVLFSDGAQRENPCSLFRINAGETHIGALAVGSPSVEVSFWDWRD